VCRAESTIAGLPRSLDPPNAGTSLAPDVVVQVWIGMVERRGRRTLVTAIRRDQVLRTPPESDPPGTLPEQ